MTLFVLTEKGTISEEDGQVYQACKFEAINTYSAHNEVIPLFKEDVDTFKLGDKMNLRKVTEDGVSYITYEDEFMLYKFDKTLN